MACTCGCEECKKRDYSAGGILLGQTHEQGGIQAIIDGQEPIEVETGEYIIRRSSTEKYGEDVMAKINQGLVNPQALRQLVSSTPVYMESGGHVHRNYREGGSVVSVFKDPAVDEIDIPNVALYHGDRVSARWDETEYSSHSPTPFNPRLPGDKE